MLVKLTTKHVWVGVKILKFHLVAHFKGVSGIPAVRWVFFIKKKHRTFFQRCLKSCFHDLWKKLRLNFSDFFLRVFGQLFCWDSGNPFKPPLFRNQIWAGSEKILEIWSSVYLWKSSFFTTKSLFGDVRKLKIFACGANKLKNRCFIGKNRI